MATPAPGALTADMEFRILGPLQVVAAGRPVALGGPRQERILAALLLAEGRPVSLTRLSEIAYDDPPERPRRLIQNRIAELRKALSGAGAGSGAGSGAARGDDPIERQGNGYLLRAAREQVDAFRFADLTARARTLAGRGDPAGAARLLREALALWRGPVLDGLDCERLHQSLVGLEDARLAALEDRFALELAAPAGDVATLVAELRTLVSQYPLRQRLVGQLMTALHYAGHQADALAVYRALADRLAEGQGLDPGPELRDLHRAILRDALPRPATATPATATPPAAAPPAVSAPAQLPLDAHGFTGRTAQLKALDTVAAAAGDQPTSVVVAAVWGTAGVGKTALAVHWAHQVRDRFPDGQLHLNLRGHDPGGPAVEPAEALNRLLTALGVPPQRIPADPDARAALYRTRLAGQRMLVLLDNARDVDQVRPLLPGTPGCLVLVTSRNRLTGLVATDGAHPLPLDELTPDEARDLLARRLGAERVAAEPDAVDDIVAFCARLPLALVIVAANAATQPRLPLADAAEQLRDSRARLDALTIGGTPATDPRAVFSWSYAALDPAVARLFRLMGGHPGPDLSAAAAASLAGLPPARVHPLLDELTRAHLVVESVSGRYTFHDLLRAYARELSADDGAATRRLLDHYLHTAHTAARLLDPGRDPIDPPPLATGVTPERPADYGPAMAWFTAEHAVLMAAVDHAAGAGFDTHAWQLAWTMNDYFDRQGHWSDWVVTQHAALAAARRLDDPVAQARAHGNLAYAHIVLGRYADAETHLRHGLALYERCGNLVGQARIHNDFSVAAQRQGRHAEALDHSLRAVELYRAAGHRIGEADTLNNVGWAHAQLGDYELALVRCQEALALLEEFGDRDGQASTWDSLGYAHHHLGHHAEAVTCYRRALELFRELGDRYYEADTLTHLGDTYHAAGAATAARRSYEQALAILDDLDNPDADDVRRKLAGLSGLR